MEVAPPGQLIISEVRKVMNSWNIKFNNKEFKFELGKSENNKSIIFKLKKYKENLSVYYKLIINEENLKNLNPLFHIYQKIDEIYYLLLDAINDKQYSINEKDRNVILTLNFYVIKKKIEIPFNLLEQRIQKENSNKEVYELVIN